MRKPKRPKNPMAKFRSAIRLIWSRSAERKAIIKQAQYVAGNTTHYYAFRCPLCEVEYPIQMADVDHNPAIGSLNSIDELSDFTKRMFFGPQRVICKICHRRKTQIDRREMKRIKQ